MMFELSEDIMYRALVEKDKSYEGSFYAAIKTTGIFCRPTCTARKPLQKNTEFYYSSREALAAGYRPCLVCKPMEKPGITPDYIKDLIEELQDDPCLKIKEWDLKKRGIDPGRMRRWFMKNHGMSFQAYQRMMRINTAFEKIQQGEKVSDVAFDSGYESLSGFSESFRKILGINPSSGKEKASLNIKRFTTPLGSMYACATDEGLCLLEFSDRPMLETEFKDLMKKLNAVIIASDHPFFEKLEKELAEYYDGKRKTFSVPLFFPGSEFQQNVWRELMNIPYGQTRSYKQQAIAMGKPAAVRAVANANGMNKIAILIPCHRVIGEDGSLTGYGGGLWRKKYLLDLEKNS